MSSSFGKDSRGADSKAESGRPRRGSPSTWRRTPTILDGGTYHRGCPTIYPGVFLGKEELLVFNVPGTLWSLKVFAGDDACVRREVGVVLGGRAKPFGCDGPWQPAAAPQRARARFLLVLPRTSDRNKGGMGPA